MPPKGMASAFKGKQAAAADPKQKPMGIAWALGTKRVGELPSALPAKLAKAPEAAHVTSTRVGREKVPKFSEEDSIKLEVNAIVHP